MVDVGQPVRRTLSVWVYGKKMMSDRCIANDGYISTKVLHNNNPDKRRPIGIEKDHTGWRASKTG